jgi:hypothetical protein
MLSPISSDISFGKYNLSISLGVFLGFILKPFGISNKIGFVCSKKIGSELSITMQQTYQNLL